MRSLALLLVLAAAPAVAAPRIHFDVQNVSATPSAPSELSVKARTLLEELIAARPEFVKAPGKGVKAFGVTLNLDEYRRSLAPDTKPGANGQILTIHVGVQLVGTAIPSGSLALAGSGQSTVMAEVGNNLRPREEESATDDALREALTHAVDEAVARLSKPPPRAHPPRKVKPR